ncbi:MAG: hypothetical protein ACJLS3_08200 [Erythrobacter sp.]
MIKEQRRLALVRLQAMMAGMARREAMRALADALDEERRRHALAQRSAALLAEAAGGRAGAAMGDDLARRTRFAAGVARIAGDAAAARGDALRQAEWQASQLAAAEARARRLAELEIAAASALAQAQEQRAAQLGAAMARKLQRRSDAPFGEPARVSDAFPDPA